MKRNDTTVAVRLDTLERLKSYRYALIGQLGTDLSYSDVIDLMLDSVGWAKKKK